MNCTDARIGFIGFGSMASAICDGLLLKDAVKGENMTACARSWDKLVSNCEKRGIHAVKSAAEVAEASDIVVIGVLPEQVEPVVKEIADELKGKLIVSIAAGVECHKLVGFLGGNAEDYHVISTIPNTPISIGEGIIFAESTHTLTQEQLETFEAVFGQVGVIEYFSTELLTFAGCGAGAAGAFVDVMIEAVADGLVKHGISRAQAYRVLPHIISAAALYFVSSGMHPGELKDAMCSPGGTTITAIRALEQGGMRDSIIKALDNIAAKH